jgi:Ca-activated chloride channel homolog
MKIQFINTIIIAFLFTALSNADQLYSKNKKANQLYNKGEYQEALKMYDGLSVESPTEPKIKMNKGSAYYKLKDLEKAEESYNNAAANCKDKKTLADLYYNLGNIQYMQGEELAGQGKQEAKDKYKGALENYIKSLDIKPHDKDTKWNLQLASARMKQMQNQQNQQQNKNDKNNKDKNKDQNKDQQQQNKDQEKKDQDKQNQDQQKKDDKKQDKQDQKNQQNENKQDQQKPDPTPAQKKEDMKKDDAKKLLELYSDDEHDLNKKPEKKGIAGQKRSEKDW